MFTPAPTANQHSIVPKPLLTLRYRNIEARLFTGIATSCSIQYYFAILFALIMFSLVQFKHIPTTFGSHHVESIVGAFFRTLIVHLAF